jgi:hypothetical protein
VLYRDVVGTYCIASQRIRFECLSLVGGGGIINKLVGRVGIRHGCTGRDGGHLIVSASFVSEETEPSHPSRHERADNERSGRVHDIARDRHICFVNSYYQIRAPSGGNAKLGRDWWLIDLILR